MSSWHYQIMKRTDEYEDDHQEDWYGVYQYHEGPNGIFYEETPIFEKESVEELLQTIWRMYLETRKNGVKIYEG